MRFLKIAIVTITFIVAGSAAQGQTTSSGAAFQKPGLGKEQVKVKFLVGSFATSTYIPPNPAVPKGDTGKGTSVIAWALDSVFLSIEDQSFNSLFGHYNAHGMLGFDAQTHQIVLSMFNNFGDRPTYSGDFVGDTLVLQAKIPAPRGTFDQKLLWYQDGEDVILRVLNDFGRGFMLSFEQRATPEKKK